MRSNLEGKLREAYMLMRAWHGHQRWWPGETPFEVCIGAILVQNTAWSNAERAIANLKGEGLLGPAELADLPVARLENLIRPSGSFRVKARRLRSFLSVLHEQHGGQLESLFAGPAAEVRTRLLAIHGIGPETADCLLLYAGGHARFVIDAYTRRIFQRHGWRPAGAPRHAKGKGRASRYSGYEAWQAMCEKALARTEGRDLLDYWGDYHAQLVAVGKSWCRASVPRCGQCPLAPLLPSGGPL